MPLYERNDQPQILVSLGVGWAVLVPFMHGYQRTDCVPYYAVSAWERGRRRAGCPASAAMRATRDRTEERKQKPMAGVSTTGSCSSGTCRMCFWGSPKAWEAPPLNFPFLQERTKGSDQVGSSQSGEGGKGWGVGVAIVETVDYCLPDWIYKLFLAQGTIHCNTVQSWKNRRKPLLMLHLYLA